MLVVLGHIVSPFSTVIFSFHIPLFFFLGGVFIKTTYTPADFLKRNFVRLLVPYLIFGALGLLVNDIKNVFLHRPQEDVFQSIVGLLYWMDYPHLQHYGFVLWFLPALFWARLISYGLTQYLKLNEGLVFLLCVACAYVFSDMVQLTLPFALDKGLVALPWVFMGSVFYRRKEKFLTLPIWKIAPLALLVFLIAYFDGVPRLDFAVRNAGHFFITLSYTFAVIFLIVWLIYNARFGESAPLRNISAFISRFGSESMLVYIAHPYTNNGAYLLSNYLLGEGYWYIKFALTVAMLMVVIGIKLRYQGSLLFKYL